MSKISVEQRFAMLAKLGEHVDWDSLTVEQVQVGIREAHSFAGKEFEDFIRNGFRVQALDFFWETDKLTIQIPALPRPTLAELQGKFSWIRSVRDTSPTEAVTLRLGTVLREGESRIGGAEYERRLSPKQSILLGYQHACWLVEHQDEFPQLMALLGKVYIDFPGLVVVAASGGRDCLYLDQDGGRWKLRWRWFDFGFSSGGRLAASASSNLCPCDP